MGKLKGSTVAFSISAMVALSGCADGKGPSFDFLKKKPGAGEAAAPETPEVTRAAGSTALIERDVEAPDVFSKTTEGLWDGRPSLGGVWVAHKDVKEPERVLIRNEANGKSVIGALFQRERGGPGPEFQVSSDAADALVVVAGAPVSLSVVALRKEEAPEPVPETALAAAEGEQTVPDAGEIKTASLDAPKKKVKGDDQKVAVETAAATPAAPAPTAKKPVIKPINDPVLGSRLPKKTGGTVDPIKATAQAAIARSSDTKTKPIKASARAAGGLSKPFIQIGIFSVKGNADNTATSLRNIGILPTVKEQTSKGKVFWRVVVGPATSSSERGQLLKKVKDLGFNDAYFVTN